VSAIRDIVALAGRHRLILAVLVAVALAAVGVGVAALRPPEARPADDVLATARGLYFTASFTSSVRPVPINTMHTWTVWITDTEGRPVTDASVKISGDMPGHGHGLPTAPVARAIGGGVYALEGMQFQMPGDWYVELQIESAGRRDSVRFNFTL
jgi:hypothetical protein